jgi:uridine kinase
MKYTIGVCGDSGSGKTTLSKRLFDFLGDCLILECDRYHKWERGDDHWNKYTHLSLQANHLDLMQSDVSLLVRGKPIMRSDYDHNTGIFTTPKSIPPKKNLVVCGLHALYCEDVFDVKVYMNTEDNLRTFWKISRDTTNRGYTFDSVKKQIEDRKPDFIKYILPQRDLADVVVNFYSEAKDKLDMAKGIGKKLEILVKNSTCSEALYKAYKDKSISVVVSKQGDYNKVEFLSYPTSDVSYYYDHILVCILEMLKIKCNS